MCRSVRRTDLPQAIAVCLTLLVGHMTLSAERAAAQAAEAGDAAPQTEEPDTATEAPRGTAPPFGAVASEEAKRAGQFERLAPPDPERFPNLKSLSPKYDVWVDAERKRVVLRGGVCLRKGPLELFACVHQWIPDEFNDGEMMRRSTKEYESVVSINTTAALVHTGLLAVGAEPGSPVQFTPEYQPARGTRIDVHLSWEGEDGKPQEARAQEWIRNSQTSKPMAYSWVFAGSGFLVNKETGERRYLGENGNLICVSNFPDAVMDLPIQSTATNSALLFEAFTEHIPPVGTPVTIVLIPDLAAE